MQPWVVALALLCVVLIPRGLALHPDDLAIVQEAMTLVSRDHLPGWADADLPNLCDTQWVDCVDDSIVKIEFNGNSTVFFAGELSCRWFDLANLTSLNIRDNQYFSGNPSLCTDACANHPTTLIVIVLSSNNMTGPVPLFPLCQGLQYIAASGNRLEGFLPTALLRPSLNSINMASNFLKGTIPQAFFDHPGIKELVLHNNYFYGTLPANNTNPSWNRLQLTDNWLEGPIPAWVFQHTYTELTLGHNNFDCPSDTQALSALNNSRSSFDALPDCNLGRNLPTYHRTLMANPFLNTKTYADEPSSPAPWVFQNSRVRMEKFGTRFYLFAVQPDGVAFKEEYLRFEVFGMQVMIDGSLDLIDELGLDSLTNETLVEGAKYRFNGTLANGAVESVIWEFDRPGAVAKLSFVGTNLAFGPNDKLRIPTAWSVFSPMSADGLDLTYTTAYTDGNIVNSPIFNAIAMPILLSTPTGDSLGVRLATTSTKLNVTLDFPSNYFINGVEASDVIKLKGERYLVPFGSGKMQEVLKEHFGARPTNMSRQSYTWLTSVEFAETGAVMAYDPDVNLGLLFGATVPETQTPDALALTGGAIAGIVVAAVVFAGVSGTIVMFRKRIFPNSFRGKDGLSSSTPIQSKEGSTSNHSKASRESSAWQNPDTRQSQLKNV